MQNNKSLINCIEQSSESPLFIGFSELFFDFVGKKWVKEKRPLFGRFLLLSVD